MLQDAFSFEGRIGRLHFFVANVCLWLGVGVAALAMIAVLTPVPPRGWAGTGGVLVVVAGLAIAALWFSLALHVRRIRDIGWSPLLVILGWLVFQLIDSAVVARMPWLASSQHHTRIGAICNFVLWLVLQFMPGRDAGDDADADPRPARFVPLDGGPPARPDVALPRIAAGLPRPAPAGFGRRGLR